MNIHSSIILKSVLGIIVYVIVSNTLWLLFGSRLLQFLPGVNNKGINGTFRIAAMLLAACFGTLIWVVKLFFAWAGGRKVYPPYLTEISLMISRVSKLVSRRIVG
jgi:hypothetical protein